MQTDSLVSLYRLVLRRGFPRKHDPASGERHFGQPIPKPVRIAARRGLVVVDGQRPVGNVQFGCGLRPGGPHWPVRASADEACGCPGAWHIGHGNPTCTVIWKVSRGQPLTGRWRKSRRDLQLPMGDAYSNFMRHLFSEYDETAKISKDRRINKFRGAGRQPAAGFRFWAEPAG